MAKDWSERQDCVISFFQIERESTYFENKLLESWIWTLTIASDANKIYDSTSSTKLACIFYA